MKCYYEELGVERDVGESEIKSAYRKLALRWHPDKNPECIEIAKEKFQLIQQAYEVLSDPRERAWYDNHREQIIRGKNSNYEDDCLNVFQYFTVSCFKGYGDDENGFYAVYQEVFKKISIEDAEFMECEDLQNIPRFGDSKSSYEDVVGPFYAYWSAYCTKRTYAWLCPYDVREIKDRRILREIDKEMKKIVQNAKKERNEEVRNLVSFVRKRDKRVQAFKRLLEERSALNRQKQTKKRMEQIRRRQEDLKEMINRSHEANRNNDYEEQLKQLELEYSSEDEFCEDELAELGGLNDNNDSLFCVACNKEFKNDKSFANHEVSRKHRENVERLKIEMQTEDNCYQKNETPVEDRSSFENGEGSKKLSNNSKEHKTENESEEYCYQESDSSFEDIVEFKELNAKEPVYSNGEHDLARLAKKGKIKNKKEARNIKSYEIDEASENEEFVEETNTLKESQDWDTKHKKGSKKNTKKIRTKETKPIVLEEHTQTKNKTQPTLKNGDVCTLQSESIQHVCATCKSNFESKNKLFSHLKLTNHAIIVPNGKVIKTEKNKNRRKN